MPINKLGFSIQVNLMYNPMKMHAAFQYDQTFPPVRSAIVAPLLAPYTTVQPSRGDPETVFAREMGRRYRANGDGWGSMCRAADKLFLINGFSPGHLISLALSLKSNLTLCMSVNINKPSNPALKCHLLCRTWCQAREPIWWRGRFLCVFEIGSEGGKEKREILLSFQTSINTEQVQNGSGSKATLYIAAAKIHTRFWHSSSVLHSAIYIIPFYHSTLSIVNQGLVMCMPTYCYINAFQRVKSGERTSFHWGSLATL